MIRLMRARSRSMVTSASTTCASLSTLSATAAVASTAAESMRAAATAAKPDPRKVRTQKTRLQSMSKTHQVLSSQQAQQQPQRQQQNRPQLRPPTPLPALQSASLFFLSFPAIDRWIRELYREATLESPPQRDFAPRGNFQHLPDNNNVLIRALEAQLKQIDGRLRRFKAGTTSAHEARAAVVLWYHLLQALCDSRVFRSLPMKQQPFHSSLKPALVNWMDSRIFPGISKPAHTLDGTGSPMLQQFDQIVLQHADLLVWPPGDSQPPPPPSSQRLPQYPFAHPSQNACAIMKLYQRTRAVHCTQPVHALLLEIVSVPTTWLDKLRMDQKCPPVAGLDSVAFDAALHLARQECDSFKSPPEMMLPKPFDEDSTIDDTPIASLSDRSLSAAGVYDRSGMWSAFSTDDVVDLLSAWASSNCTRSKSFRWRLNQWLLNDLPHLQLSLVQITRITECLAVMEYVHPSGRLLIQAAARVMPSEQQLAAGPLTTSAWLDTTARSVGTAAQLEPSALNPVRAPLHLDAFLSDASPSAHMFESLRSTLAHMFWRYALVAIVREDVEAQRFHQPEFAVSDDAIRAHLRIARLLCDDFGSRMQHVHSIQDAAGIAFLHEITRFAWSLLLLQAERADFVHRFVASFIAWADALMQPLVAELYDWKRDFPMTKLFQISMLMRAQREAPKQATLERAYIEGISTASPATAASSSHAAAVCRPQSTSPSFSPGVHAGLHALMLTKQGHPRVSSLQQQVYRILTAPQGKFRYQLHPQPPLRIEHAEAFKGAMEQADTPLADFAAREGERLLRSAGIRNKQVHLFEEHTTDVGYVVDCVLIGRRSFDWADNPAPPNAPPDPADVERARDHSLMCVALELDGPYHFGFGYQDARTRMRRRVMRACGWQIVGLPYWEWNWIVSQAGQSQWLRKHILHAVDRRHTTNAPQADKYKTHTRFTKIT